MQQVTRGGTAILLGEAGGVLPINSVTLIASVETTEEKMVRKAFALALRGLRRQSGFSQEKLALEGVNRSHVSEMERGRRDPKLSMLFRLSSLLGISFMTFAREIDRHYTRLVERERNKPPQRD